MLDEVEEVFIGHGGLCCHADSLGVRRSLIVDARTLSVGQKTTDSKECSNARQNSTGAKL